MFTKALINELYEMVKLPDPKIILFLSNDDKAIKEAPTYQSARSMETDDSFNEAPMFLKLSYTGLDANK